MTSLGPGIFWTTLAAVTAILSLATFIGRAWSPLFPNAFQGLARFYLAPALGLASLTLIASVTGRSLPLGDSIIMPWLVVALVVWALVREQYLRRAFRHAATVSGFGIVCGASILGPLFLYGGFNAHNDAFTYLVHGHWLQEHAFGETLSPERVTPLITQVFLYQKMSLRMGASFLLALLQALLNVRWSYEIYPAVVVAGVAACCLAIGFPLAGALRLMRRSIRLALLALPAFTLGGLVFGANLGFLPQTIGLALGASLLFAVGPLFRWVATTSATRLAIWKLALPIAVLLVGAIFAYSELAPLLLLAVLSSAFVLAVRFHALKNMLVHGGMLLGLSIGLLNTELPRAYAALRMQFGAVVGSPVDWTLLGYIAHAFGVHGGAWDGFQWTTPENTGTLFFALGVVVLALMIGTVLAGARSIWRSTITGVLMPTIAVLMMIAGGVLYFRYVAPSPFPKGQGQSWSQFKLSEWAHPFVMALLLLAVASFRSRLGKLFDSAVVALFVIGVVSAALVGVNRTMPLMRYYNGVHDLNRFYFRFRDAVLNTCPSKALVYLALGGQHHKFRQMAALYLYDREVTSDWTGDDYIFAALPVERRTQELTAGNCVVESLRPDSGLSQGMLVGPFRVGVFDGQGRIAIESVVGAYDRESDGNNWWYWVEHKVTFKLRPLFVPKDATLVKLRFEYATRGAQTLALRVIKRDGTSQGFSLPSKGDGLEIFERFIDLPPTEVAELSIETDGIASPLGNGDHRWAAWNVRNMSFSVVSP